MVLSTGSFIDSYHRFTGRLCKSAVYQFASNWLSEELLNLLARVDGLKVAALHERVRVYVQTLRDNVDCCFAAIDAKLRVMDGDEIGAIEVLDMGLRREELDWDSRYDPIIRTLQGEPAFRALYQRVDDEIDAFRLQLGMPALQQ